MGIAVDELRDEVVVIGSIQGHLEEQASFPIGREYDANTPNPGRLLPKPMQGVSVFPQQ